MNKILLATNNANKLREFRQIFEGSGIQIVSPKEIGISHDVDEDADTFKGNAYKKAYEFMKISGLPSVADDSGLCVVALDGQPGVYSARFASKSGENSDDNANNEKLLRLMKDKTDRRGYYVCALALVDTDESVIEVEGECWGEIAHERSGEGGFGYDCLFYLPQFNCTMASISPEQKNSMSHRSKAIHMLLDKLRDVKNA
ncbi:MAG: RdgB/HAM1 family non-canonical purine NTP pyrophosphatase [Eubacteriales bacterium]|nr:RdgB/HAM1 family non-canonical purine NTP pyrophosphatase [Eubacteriales bacterium]